MIRFDRGRHCTESMTFYLLTQVAEYGKQHQHPGNDTNQHAKSDNEQNSCQHRKSPKNLVLYSFTVAAYN